MLHVDIPTLPEIQTLFAQRNQASVSIYLETTPQTQHIGQAGKKTRTHIIFRSPAGELQGSRPLRHLP